MFKTRLVNQLEADMAEIWDVSPSAAYGTDASLLDGTAMDNADSKYWRMYKALKESSEDVYKSILDKPV